MEHAKEYFENHSSAGKLYFTSDNAAFFDEQNAKNHAKDLDDDTITAITREELDNAVEDLVTDEWDDLEFGLRDELDAE